MTMCVDRLIHTFDMIVERLSNIEARLDGMERNRAQEDAISAEGSHLSGFRYCGKPYTIVNHVGTLHMSKAWSQCIAVRFETDSRRALFMDVEEEGGSVLRFDSSPKHLRGMEKDLINELGLPEWTRLLERCGSIDPDHEMPVTCEMVGLAGQRPERELEDALYELVLKQRFPEQVLALEWQGLIVLVRDDGTGRTWIEHVMGIVAAALELCGSNVYDDSIGLHWICIPQKKDHTEELYFAAARGDNDGVKRAYDKMDRRLQGRIRVACDDEHSFLYAHYLD